MNDRTVHRAIHQGAKTARIESKPRPRQIKVNADLAADEVAAAVAMARDERAEQDIREYAERKRAS